MRGTENCLFLVAYTRLYESLCRLVRPPVLNAFLFSPKGELISFIAPSHRTRLILSCIVYTAMFLREGNVTTLDWIADWVGMLYCNI